jgi:hypothetical protein
LVVSLQPEGLLDLMLDLLHLIPTQVETQLLLEALVVTAEMQVTAEPPEPVWLELLVLLQERVALVVLRMPEELMVVTVLLVQLSQLQTQQELFLLLVVLLETAE